MELLASLGGSVVLASITDQWVEWFGSLFGSHALTAIAIAKIIGINIILSGDNAVVIALACRNLKPRERTWGIILGAGAAVVLRIIFTVIIQHLLGIPWLQLCGGLLLIWIAVKLLIADEPEDDNVASGSNLWEAVKIVAIADVVMSLDNVLAIAATAHGDFMLVMFGIGLSLPIVVWGAGLLAHLMNRHTWIVWLGGGLLGYVAGEMVIEDPVVTRWLAGATPVLHLAVPIALGVAVTAIGWWLGRGHHHVHVPEKL
jgi:YjbE family integral membrane protein